MPTCRQINDVYEACTNLSASCDNLDTHAAIAACEDVIRASKVVLAVLGGPGPDVSDSSSSEESPLATTPLVRLIAAMRPQARQRW